MINKNLSMIASAPVNQFMHVRFVGLLIFGKQEYFDLAWLNLHFQKKL